LNPAGSSSSRLFSSTTATMSNLFVELKTPITGPYQQPTGLYVAS
jgi:hypothetical protein